MSVVIIDTASNARGNADATAKDSPGAVPRIYGRVWVKPPLLFARTRTEDNGEWIYNTEVNRTGVVGGSPYVDAIFALGQAGLTIRGVRCNGETAGLKKGSIDAWKSSTTYAAGAQITYGGDAYTSLAGSNVGHTPSSSPTWWSRGWSSPVPWVTSGDDVWFGLAQLSGFRADGTVRYENTPSGTFYVSTRTYPSVQFCNGIDNKEIVHGTSAASTAAPTWTSLPSGAVPWAYLAGTEAEGLAYAQLTTLRFEACPLSAIGGYIRDFEVLVDGIGGVGCGPEEVVRDILVNLMGYLDSEVDTTHGPDGLAASSYHTWCAEMAATFVVASAIVGDPRDLLTDILRVTCAELVQLPGGGIRIQPRASAAKGAYSPPTIAYTITADDVDEDGITIVERPESECPNIQTVAYEDPGSKETRYYTHRDTFDIEDTKPRRGQPISSKWITNAVHARWLAEQTVNAALSSRKAWTFKVPPRYLLVEIGDLLSVGDGVLPVSLVRVASVDGDSDLTLELTCEQWNGDATPKDITPELPREPIVPGPGQTATQAGMVAVATANGMEGTAAQAAQAAADAAQADADTALGQLTSITSDDVLSPVEKTTIIRDYTVLTAEQAGIDAEADRYSVSRTAYDSAVSALTSYLGSLTTPVPWNNVGGNTTIVGTAFRSMFAAVYTARQALLNAVTAAAKALADRTVGGGNFVRNSSFERDSDGNGWPDYWRAHTGVQAVAPSSDSMFGGISLQLTASGAASCRIWPTDTGVERVFVKAGTPTVRSAHFKAPVGSTLIIILKGHSAQTGTTEVLSVQGASAVATGEWQRVVIQYTPTVDAWLSLNPGLSNTPAAGTQFLIDAVSLRVGEVDPGWAASAADAQTDADAAKTAAAAAQADATSALSTLTDIASDSLLTPGEKPTVIKDYAVITGEQAGIDAQATAYGITTAKTTYDTAVSALTTYLATLTTPKAWNDLTGNTTIVGATFRTKFQDVYAARQALLNAIYAAAKGLADGAQSTADTAAAVAAGKNKFTRSATPPGSPATGDLWSNSDTTTNCPDNNCKGHTATGDTLNVGAYPHRKTDWIHRWNGSAWVDAQAADKILASEMVVSSLAAISADLGTCTAGVVRTSNYAEDGSGNPTAGAKLDISGTALKVAPGGLQVGAFPFNELIRMGSTSFTINDTAANVSLSPAFPDTNYRVLMTVRDFSGSPAANSRVVTRITKATNGFTVLLAAAPGTGATVYWDWLVIHEFP